ncbi:MAG TPA: hypothetical protein VFV39_10465 [Limnobacter sp.]|nr:hypothetical protein [Limnobacter sp.]
MKESHVPCVVFSDYPIKQIGYARFLKSLSEKTVALFNEYPSGEMLEFSNAGLVIFDMNIDAEHEHRYRQSLMRVFPKANVLFMEENHGDLHYQLIHKRDVCCLGKLAEVGTIHACIKDLLLRNAASRSRSSKKTNLTDRPDTEMV